MKEPIPIDRLDWAIGARARSQKLLLALYDYGNREGYGSPESAQAWLFSSLVAVAFALWRAAFLADSPTRTWPEALRDAQELLETVLRTNTISFGTEHTLQGWTAGYYLKNAKLRLEDIFRSQRKSDRAGAEEDLTRVEGISLMETDPHETWNLFCGEAERLAQQLG